MVINVKHRNCYGVDLIDVCDPHQAEIIGHLTGKKTVSLKDIDNLRALGHEVIDLDEQIKIMFVNLPNER